MRGNHMRVDQRGSRATLGKKPLDVVRIATGQAGLQYLQSTPTQQVAVSGEVHATHAAHAEQQLDVVAVEIAADEFFGVVAGLVRNIGSINGAAIGRTENNRATATRAV